MPRILCILAILFISIFALDAFNTDQTFWQKIADFSMHLIPSFVIIVLLIVAWKWELPGGILMIVLAIGFMPLVYSMNFARTQSVLISLSIVLMINFPFVVTGVLFILSYFLKRKNRVQ
jgi:uncharacterized membrane protein AbrB (regulator of aidB expression)